MRLFSFIFPERLEKFRQEYQKLVGKGGGGVAVAAPPDWKKAHESFLARLRMSECDDNGREQDALMHSAVQHDDLVLLKVMQAKFGDERMTKCDFQGSLLGSAVTFNAAECFPWLLTEAPWSNKQNVIDQALGCCHDSVSFVEPLLAAGANPLSVHGYDFQMVRVAKLQHKVEFLEALQTSPSLDAGIKKQIEDISGVCANSYIPAEFAVVEKVFEDTLCFPEIEIVESGPRAGI